MTTRQTNRVLIHLRRVALLSDRGGVTDAQLLERFLARREEIAFEELVRRHGPMVLGVCRRVLGEPQDAADAFQATFLVLFRRAAFIVPRSRVGPWLYGVARRTALKARSAAARRRRAEREAARDRPRVTAPAEPDGDLRPLLDEELGQLPDKYRSPLVLCLLEGRSRQEAAGLLGWSEGTLSGRLARAKELLGKRLRRRGVTTAGVALAAALVESATAAEVPTLLSVATVNAAASLGGPAAAGTVSASVVALTKEVTKAMMMLKLKAATAVLVLVAGVGLGAGAVAWQFGSAARGAAPEGAESDGKRAAAPRKNKEARPPAYVIEPPDVLLVAYTQPGGPFPVRASREHLVRPDGTVSLGQLGALRVAGLTPEEARGAIAKHLAGHLEGFDRRGLTVEVVAYNSKVFYVIAADADGEQIYRFPQTGSETVLDAISGSNIPLIGLGRRRVYVARKSADGKGSQVLPVDWQAILQGGSATNYLLLPGDRLYIKNAAPERDEGRRRRDAVRGAGTDPVRELEAVVKALREARSRDEQRCVVEELEVLTKKLREQLKEPEGVRRR